MGVFTSKVTNSTPLLEIMLGYFLIFCPICDNFYILLGIFLIFTLQSVTLIKRGGNMLYSYQDMLKRYGTKYYVQKAVDEKEIYKYEKNVYSDKALVNPVLIYQRKYPYAILTLNTAFYYQKLTTVASDKIYLATPSRYRTIHNKEIRQVFVPNPIFKQGMEVLDIEGEKIQCYNKERLLVELIRKRNQIPFDYYKQLLNKYRSILKTLDYQKIEEYTLLYGNKARIQKELRDALGLFLKKDEKK